MEAFTLQQREPQAAVRRLQFRPLWLQSDEGLMVLVRAGSGDAYAALVRRYQTRLLAFCRQMLKVETDAEDVLQEVFTAAFYAMRADDRPLDVKPWFYRIARNRCLNHIRGEAGMRALTAEGGGHSDEVNEAQGADGGFSAADRASRRQDFRQLVRDVLSLPDSQRSALVLREMHGLSYEEIADAMSTSVSSVKSLLVRARGSLLEIAEARELTCEEARHELTEDAEGLGRPQAAVRSHVKRCSSCTAAHKRLKATNKALAAVTPFWPVATLKAVLFAKTSPAAGTLGSASLSGVSGSATAGASAGGGMLAVAAKTAVGLSTVVALAGGMSAGDRGGWPDGGSAGATPTPAGVQVPALPATAAPIAPTKGGAGPDETGREEERSPLPESRPAPPAPGTIPPAPGTIESSPREVIPGVTETAPSRQLAPSERLPGTSARGRPAPDAGIRYRTRPAPPGSSGEAQADTPPAPVHTGPEPKTEDGAPPAEEPAAPAEGPAAPAKGQFTSPDGQPAS